MDLSVESRFRKEGRASQILGMAHTLFMDYGFTHSWLWAERGTWMYEWYKRLGYETYGPHEKYEESDWMTKDLTIKPQECEGVTPTILT